MCPSPQSTALALSGSLPPLRAANTATQLPEQDVFSEYWFRHAE